MSEYNKILQELNTDCIADYVITCNYGKSLEEIYNLIQEEYIKHTSANWFPGDIVLLHPSIRERHAESYYSTVHETIISKGSLYINYNALLINLTSNTKYVIKSSLKFEPSDFIPKTIF